MHHIYFNSDFKISEFADKDSIARKYLNMFLKQLPEECRKAHAGLDPDKDELLIHIIPTQPHPSDLEGSTTGGQIFMGMGERSVRERGLLYKLIGEAFSTISGMQQNGGMGYAFNEEYNAKSQVKLDEIARKVAKCLTGDEYRKVEENEN